MLAGPFAAKCVVAPMCFYCKRIDVAMIVHGDDCVAEGRAEALLQVGGYLKNKFRINLVSLAGHGHEKENRSLEACDHHTTLTDRTGTGDPTHSNKFENELNFGGAKGASHALVPRQQE